MITQKQKLVLRHCIQGRRRNWAWCCSAYGGGDQTGPVNNYISVVLLILSDQMS